MDPFSRGYNLITETFARGHSRRRRPVTIHRMRTDAASLPIHRAPRFAAFLLALPACWKAADAPTEQQGHETASGEDGPVPTSRRRTARKPKETRDLQAKVFGVSDGDAVTVRAADETGPQLRIRLRGIDAPEKAQAFGQRSKELLSSLVFGKSVRLVSTSATATGEAWPTSTWTATAPRCWRTLR